MLEEACCTNSNMPQFMTTLIETTSEDIKLRMCGSELPSDEVCDLYVPFE